MAKYYQIVFKSYDEKPANIEGVIFEGSCEAPTNILDFGIRHKEQINLISNAQSKILQLQANQITPPYECLDCGSSDLKKLGFKETMFFDVFSDHKVKMQRFVCSECGATNCGTVLKALGGNISGELAKLHAELGARHSYRESESLLSIFSGNERMINNHDRVQSNVDAVGMAVVSLHEEADQITAILPADELILQVDGGHIKSAEEDGRSFEAMTAVVYRPESIIAVADGRNTLASKHCAASTKLDNQQQMKQNTLVAALKEGLCPATRIIALCDGADNCWNIVDSIGQFAASTTKILDWFHLSMKHHNIAVPHNGDGYTYYVVDHSDFITQSSRLNGIYKVQNNGGVSYHQILDNEIIDLKLKSEDGAQKLKQNKFIPWGKLETLFDGYTTIKSQYESVLWNLWHGKISDAVNLLQSIMSSTDNKTANKLSKFLGYIKNNSDKIINYDERKRNNQIFTSSLAESTVESLINQRCKGQQHMRWTREGLDPVLQIRAAVASDDWSKIWTTAVLNAVSKPTK